MKVLVLSLRDAKLQSFMPPFFAQTEAAGVRMVSDLVNSNNKDNNIVNHPEDFELFLVGTFSDDDGVLEAIGPRPVVQVANLVRSVQ